MPAGVGREEACVCQGIRERIDADSVPKYHLQATKQLARPASICLNDIFPQSGIEWRQVHQVGVMHDQKTKG